MYLNILKSQKHADWQHAGHKNSIVSTFKLHCAIVGITAILMFNMFINLCMNMQWRKVPAKVSLRQSDMQPYKTFQWQSRLYTPIV